MNKNIQNLIGYALLALLITGSSLLASSALAFNPISYKKSHAFQISDPSFREEDKDEEMATRNDLMNHTMTNTIRNRGNQANDTESKKTMNATPEAEVASDTLSPFAITEYEEGYTTFECDLVWRIDTSTFNPTLVTKDVYNLFEDAQAMAMTELGLDIYYDTVSHGFEKDSSGNYVTWYTTAVIVTEGNSAFSKWMKENGKDLDYRKRKASDVEEKRFEVLFHNDLFKLDPEENNDCYGCSEVRSTKPYSKYTGSSDYLKSYAITAQDRQTINDTNGFKDSSYGNKPLAPLAFTTGLQSAHGPTQDFSFTTPQNSNLNSRRLLTSSDWASKTLSKTWNRATQAMLEEILAYPFIYDLLMYLENNRPSSMCALSENVSDVILMLEEVLGLDLSLLQTMMEFLQMDLNDQAVQAYLIELKPYYDALKEFEGLNKLLDALGVSIPNEVVRDPDGVTEDEYASMQAWDSLTTDLLSNINNPNLPPKTKALVKKFARYQHEASTTYLTLASRSFEGSIQHLLYRLLANLNNLAQNQKDNMLMKQDGSMTEYLYWITSNE